MVNLELEDHSVKREEGTVNDDCDVVKRVDADEREEKNFESGKDKDSSFIWDKLYQLDQFHFRSLLPEEMWRLILNKMNDSPEDMESCANASPYFRELLSGQRVLFLFPKVLGILIDRYNPTRWQMTRMTGEDVDEKPEDLILNKNLQDEVTDEDVAKQNENLEKWRNTVLTCRRVCSNWNQSVEQCYEKPMYEFTIRSTQKAQDFMQHFEMSHHSAQIPKNPFYRRYLVIDMSDFLYGERGGLQEFRNEVSHLLRMFGHEVWDLIIVGVFFCDYEQLYLKFKEWFELMPNLKEIRLRSVDLEKLSQEVVEQNPLPKLEKLQRLLIWEKCGGTIVTELIRKNCHVPTLEFWDAGEFDEKVGSLLSNLTDFSAQEFSRSAREMLRQFGSSWKLKKLELEGQIQTIFQLLGSNWKDTLTELKLDIYSGGIGSLLNDSKNLRLNLPRLRQLSIRTEAFIFVDFILPLANCLEYLKIDCRDPENVNAASERNPRDGLAHGQVIQFAGFERKMHQSNIWKIFTKLKTIKLAFGGNSYEEYFVFTRKGEKLVYVKKKLLKKAGFVY